MYAYISVTGDNSSWNETHADTLYADIGVTGGNSSWNETHADTLYYDLGNSYGYWNSTFALFNKTYADTLYASTGAGNSSWNETWADTKYMEQTATTNLNMTDDYNITMGSCTSYWNGSCEIKEFPTTTSIQC